MLRLAVGPDDPGHSLVVFLGEKLRVRERFSRVRGLLPQVVSAKVGACSHLPESVMRPRSEPCDFRVNGWLGPPSAAPSA